MAVRYVEHPFLYPFRPQHGIPPATGGTEAVLAAMVYLAYLATFRTDIGINPQGGCPAHADGIDRLVLFRSDRFGRMFGILLPVQPDKVRQPKFPFLAWDFLMYMPFSMSESFCDRQRFKIFLVFQSGNIEKRLLVICESEDFSMPESYVFFCSSINSS